MKIGIEATSFYSSHYYLDLKTLAIQRGVEPEKFYHSIGQEKMAVPPPDEDVVTLAANAAEQALQGVDRERIEAIFFATESGIDQSKAAGIYVHRLLDLQPHCRVVELKQACYSGTIGVQAAAALVHRNPESKALVITADVARYGLGSAGESTQGAGAVALVVSANPKILALDPEAGYYTQDVMDFWRPNYRDEALVDGKHSVRVYLRALGASWEQYSRRSGRTWPDFARFCFHLPFTRMGEQAIRHLAKNCGQTDLGDKELNALIGDGLIYNRLVGNLYSGSLYLSLISLLENTQENLENKRIALFSYGSGCVGEFFSGVVAPEYRQALPIERHRALIRDRQELDYTAYSRFYSYALPTDGSTNKIPENETGRFRLSGLSQHQRIYEKRS
ncbi:hydroxymethylglutaryl-CoA synthase [candidate division KSB1 bacterium]|nr:hydroxymethylglutaryl-CoA synthase [candidate division KSB1 bacterium]